MLTWKRYGAVAAVILVTWSLSCGDDATGPQFAARMYIGDLDAQSVLIYASPYGPAAGPTDSLKRGTHRFFGVAADANGNLAATSGSGTGKIFFYDAPVRSGGTARDSVSFVGYGALLAFGPGGKLFVPNYQDRVFIYTPPFNSASVPDTVKTGISGAFSVAFDAGNRLYVGDIVDGTVHVYDSPYTAAPAFTVPGAATNGFLTGIAVDADGRLFVADATESRILVFQAPLSASSTPAFAITIGIDSPIGIAIGSDGTLYVSNVDGLDRPSITLYRPPFNASSAPTITMGGGGRFVTPYGIAVGPR